MHTKTVVDVVKANWIQVGMVAVGLSMLGIGMVKANQQSSGADITVVHASPSPSAKLEVKEIVIDVQGAVQKPGVYRLPQGYRIGDALIAAGGLAAKADRSFVARFINQAQVLNDGVKVYIPEVGEEPPQATGSELQAASSTGIISVNSSSVAELETLWGIGAARAATIIENRPYSSMEELATKAKIPADVIEKNKDKLGL